MVPAGLGGVVDVVDVVVGAGVVRVLLGFVVVLEDFGRPVVDPVAVFTAARLRSAARAARSACWAVSAVLVVVGADCTCVRLAAAPGWNEAGRQPAVASKPVLTNARPASEAVRRTTIRRLIGVRDMGRRTCGGTASP